MPGKGSLRAMFTGLVRDIGLIKSVDRRDGGVRLEIETGLNLRDMEIGASVCCAGICLTVVDKLDHSFVTDVSSETLNRSMIGAWRVMTRINLESSLKMGDELGGHFVFGHVDGISEVMDISPDGESHRLTFSIPKGLATLVAEKGSVTLDGVSLTVNAVTDQSFSVCIIPHTWDNTTLGGLKVGDKVNFEADMLARYVARAMGKAA